MHFNNTKKKEKNDLLVVKANLSNAVCQRKLEADGEMNRTEWKKKKQENENVSQSLWPQRKREREFVLILFPFFGINATGGTHYALLMLLTLLSPKM